MECTEEQALQKSHVKEQRRETIRMNFSLWTTQRILQVDPLELDEQDSMNRELNGLQKTDHLHVDLCSRLNKNAKNKQDNAKKLNKRRQKLMMNPKTAVRLLVQN